MFSDLLQYKKKLDTNYNIKLTNQIDFRTQVKTKYSIK